MRLSPHEERDFEDGEHKARPLVSVRDNDVFVVQSLYGDREASGDQKLMRLLFLSARYATVSAARITALVPYLVYAGKDGKTQPRSATTRLRRQPVRTARDLECRIALRRHRSPLARRRLDSRVTGRAMKLRAAAEGRLLR
ncbi:MAG: ribose-phosphate pyrophosphokinase-like domain-containing protein [Sulfurifustaceae bacterium]